jgi:hypothetical protein
MSALGEWKANLKRDHSMNDSAARAIAELKAELERLREESIRLQCCANCGQPHSLSLGECYSKPAVINVPERRDGWTVIEPDWRCQFSPSRWIARAEEGGNE